MALLIKNGSVVTGSDVICADVRVEGEHIVAVGLGGSGSRASSGPGGIAAGDLRTAAEREHRLDAEPAVAQRAPIRARQLLFSGEVFTKKRVSHLKCEKSRCSEREEC